MPYTHSLSQSQFNLFRFDTPHHVPFEYRSDNQAKLFRSDFGIDEIHTNAVCVVLLH